MPRVKVQAVLDKIEPDVKRAMATALRSVAPDSEIHANQLTRRFLRALDRRAPDYVRVSKTAVRDS